MVSTEPFLYATVSSCLDNISNGRRQHLKIAPHEELSSHFAYFGVYYGCCEVKLFLGIRRYS